VQRVAARYGVRPDQVATATGTSGANFLVCAALLRPGDDVLSSGRRTTAAGRMLGPA
jgi:aspartate/methionine/tyrosine aminotransferase